MGAAPPFSSSVLSTSPPRKEMACHMVPAFTAAHDEHNKMARGEIGQLPKCAHSPQIRAAGPRPSVGMRMPHADETDRAAGAFGFFGVDLGGPDYAAEKACRRCETIRWRAADFVNPDDLQEIIDLPKQQTARFDSRTQAPP